MNWVEQNWKRKFFVLWTGQSVSTFTSSVIQMAIIWYITEKTGSATILSMGTLIAFLPQAVLGLFIGVLIDRYNRKTIMIVSDIFIAAVTMILVIAGSYGEIPIWLIVVVLFARSVGTAFHDPSLNAITPLIVPKESLTKCAGYSQTFQSVSWLISPVAAAVLYGTLSLNMVLLIDVTGALFALLTLYFIKVPPADKIEQTEKKNIIKEAKEGISVLRREQGMIALLTITTLYAIIYMPIGALYPLICMSYFGGTFVEASIIEVTFSAGTLLGSVALGIWGGKIDKIGAIGKSTVIMGVGLVITGMLPPGGFKIFVVLATIMGATTPFYWGVQTAIYQSKIRSEYLGRVLSLSSSLAMFAMPIGLILSGAFAEKIGIENWFLISGILSVILAVIYFLIPSLRNCRKSDIKNENY